uniref:Nucleoprotein TPR/MLP1 domain-containing protein n=1 Tax=Physcomitrium patens TaxID=3218 RepID=A0A7I4FVD3_PHYPA
MPLFMSDSELEREQGNVHAVVSKADAFIRELQEQLETQKARADAVTINAEQTCSLIEQKFLALSAQFSQLENEKDQSFATLERRSTELAQAQAQIHKLEIEAIKHNSTTERLSCEVGELSKIKRELLEVIEHKRLELEEKNSSIKTYLNKVVELTNDRSSLEGKLHELEAEVIRSRASLTRISQDKELVEQHNAWLNDELTAKVSALLEERHESAETEAGLKFKLSEAERSVKDTTQTLQRTKEYNLELESKLSQVREELKFLKEDSAVKEEQFAAEVATAAKLLELYKQSSDDWSKKSHELEGVIKALETHLNQIEADYKEKLKTEQNAREEASKEAAELKEKLEKITAEADKDIQTKSSGDFLALADKPYTGPIEGQLALEFPGDGALIPVVASEVSGTALAAALLRDGWSLAKLYSKYQEAVDAWRHERQERRHSQSLLERVLHEIELRAEVIMEERVAHNEMVEAYHKMEEKLHQYLEDQNSLDKSCKELKAELRKKERELNMQRKEKEDLQTQVAVLLKECLDVQQRFGVGDANGETAIEYVTSRTESSASDAVISERLDIRGMVEHNTQLRTLVRTLGQQNELKEQELKEEFQVELKRRLEDIGRKVADTVKRSEEQAEIIDRLQGTVGMYRRLYEDEMNTRRLSQQNAGVPPMASGNNVQDLRKLLDNSQEEISKIREEATTRVKLLEEELTKVRQEITNMRVESARADAEASFARDQLSSRMRETENQRKEMETVLARNMEFSQTITDYQRRLRESAQKLQAAEDLARRRSIEFSVAEREKELLAAAERRSSEEVAMLSDRLHRVQAALDTMQSVEETRESMRIVEKKKLESELSNLQKEWVEARKELEIEREHGRRLTTQRDRAVSEALERVEAVSKELAVALKSVSAAETRAQVAEARCVELELSLKKADDKILLALGGSKTLVSDDGVGVDVDNEIMLNLQQTKEELERLKEDLAAAKIHTDQYKKIAHASEEALKQMEEAYLNYKDESERRRELLESEVKDLQKRVSELEADISEKDKAADVAAEEKEKALTSALKEISSLKESLVSKEAVAVESEERISSLKHEVEKLRQQWRDAQNNYQSQVLLQADTIRELTATSEKLSNLESVEQTLRERAESAEAELGSLHVHWAMEKSSLEAAKLEAEKKVKALDEQNQILLDRLEGMHIVAAESERKASVSVTESGETSEFQGGSDLQNVIRYLRRSKETADTELTLMKQERVRLQKQLEGAYRAAEEAQASLRREHESARVSLYTDEEFRTLQTQVRELNLLRESNAELREENKKSFEDCREWREKARVAQSELEPLRKRLREKEVDLEASARTLESQKAQTQRWERRVSQLLDKYKAVDLEEYQRVKNELSAIQDREKETRSSLEIARKEIQDLKSVVTKFEEEKQAKNNQISDFENRVAELDRKLQDALQNETNVKTELTRFKRHAAFQKKKIDDLNKEKEDISNETENLRKQIEELRTTGSGRRPGGDQFAAKQYEARIEQVQKDLKDANNRFEQAEREAAARQEQVQREVENQLKERDSRIQVLEKALEREKEEAKREKVRRMKNDRAYLEYNQKAQQQLASAGLAVEPSTKAAEHEETGETNQGTLQQTAQDAAPETSTAATPASSTPALSVPTTAGAAEPSAPIETTSATPVSAEPSTIITEPASGMPTAPIEPPSVVPAPPAPHSGRPLRADVNPFVPGVSTSVPPVRPSIRATSSASANAPVRPPARSIPTIPAAAPSIPTSFDIAREREMALLREKIKQEESKRKTTRRLIRPRIEPAHGATTSSMEIGEGSQEVVSEMVDADIEIPGEGKAPVISELPDRVASPPTGVGETVPSAGAVETPIVVAPPATAVSVARKRAAPAQEATLDDEVPLQDSKSEKAPPQKKSRPAEETQTEDLNSLTGVQSSAHHVENADIPSEVRPQGTTISEISDSVDHRPLADAADAPALKKPRIVHVNDITAPVQSLEKGTSSSSQNIGLLQEKADLGQKESSNLEELGGKPGGQLQEAGTESLELPVVSTFKTDGQFPGESMMMDSLPATSLDPFTNVAELVVDSMTGSAVDEAIGQFQKPGLEVDLPGGTATETITTVTTIIEEEIVTTTETVEMGTEPQNPDDAEEGEIVPEVVEDVTKPAEAVPSDANAHDSKDRGPESIAKPEVEDPKTSTTSITVDAESVPQGTEAAGPNSPLESEVPISSTSTPEVAKPADTEPSTEMSVEERLSEAARTAEVASGHRTRLATGTVQRSPGRGGTTINLADRAKERAALRQGVAAPTSPGGRRGGRGGRKRGVGAGRGRLGGAGRGEGSGTLPQGGASGTNPGDQPQQSTNPSVPHDFTNTKDSQS